VADNKFPYGDNLDVLRRYLRDESVHPTYLDPPFNGRCSLSLGGWLPGDSPDNKQS
jgi:hypothetical protein